MPIGRGVAAVALLACAAGLASCAGSGHPGGTTQSGRSATTTTAVAPSTGSSTGSSPTSTASWSPPPTESGSPGGSSSGGGHGHSGSNGPVIVTGGPGLGTNFSGCWLDWNVQCGGFLPAVDPGHASSAGYDFYAGSTTPVTVTAVRVEPTGSVFHVAATDCVGRVVTGPAPDPNADPSGPRPAPTTHCRVTVTFAPRTTAPPVAGTDYFYYASTLVFVGQHACPDRTGDVCSLLPSSVTPTSRHPVTAQWSTSLHVWGATDCRTPVGGCASSATTTSTTATTTATTTSGPPSSSATTTPSS